MAPWPCAPASQLAAPAPATKLPLGHLVHAPPAALALPAAQSVQSAAEAVRPGTVERPAAQLAQSVGALVEPVGALHLPTAQPAAQRLPAVAAKRPPGQATHAPAVVGWALCPGGQASHVAPEAAKPLAHADMTTLRRRLLLASATKAYVPVGSIVTPLG